MAESSFDVIPYEDIKGHWTRLGSGSFGNVYKGSYLGIDVAIKEVLPSSDYDVAKYFEREWRLMKEARHPNVVLYLGLSRAPDGRIFIVSEYIENGNLRLYIHDKSKPFPWRLRLSFATDICRALAYLHARKCIHRDLKGENLLLTANLRLKITDFGFARIAARNDSESKRLTYCGTDAYMSPEILLGTPFDLPTDLFSLGVVFSEIAARRLADETHFARSAPKFGIDPVEVRRRANPGCPEAFVELTLDCLKEDPAQRPLVKDVLERLRGIELEVLARPTELDDGHVGSIKFLTAGRRPALTPRIPSFGMGIAKDIKGGQKDVVEEAHSDGDSDDEEFLQALVGLEAVDLGPQSSLRATQPLLDQATTSVSAPPSRVASSFSNPSDYSTTVIRVAPTGASRSSILTVHVPFPAVENGTESQEKTTTIDATPSTATTATVRAEIGHGITESMLSIESFHTATGSMFSVAGATEGGSTLRGQEDDVRSIGGSTLRAAVELGNDDPHGEVGTGFADGESDETVENEHDPSHSPLPSLPSRPPALLHRFTLIRPGTKRTSVTVSAASLPPSPAPSTALPIVTTTTTTSNGGAASTAPAPAPIPLTWSPFDFIFSSGLLVARCDLCSKRLGWKPVLECDDCGLRTHIKCGDFAPRDCGVRPGRSPTLNMRS